MSTSDTQSQRSSRNASEVPQPRPSLRPIAPKPPQITLPSRSQKLVVPSQRTSRPSTCPVCLRRWCQLKTHRTLAAHSQRRPSPARSDDGSGKSYLSPRERLAQSAYTKSYAYYYAQAYVDKDIASSRIDPFFDLPLPSDVNTPEMHLLFHKYFTIDSNRSIDLPRPPELANDAVLSPFLLPAMQDSALCLAILTASAASRPQRSGRAAENVAVLTLFDQAMFHLRERLGSGPGVSDATVAAATFLWAINSRLNDADSMRQHGQSVHALVTRRGGLAQLGLGGAVAQLVMMIDNLNAIIFGEKTLYLSTSDAVPLEKEPPSLCGAYFTGPRARKALDAALCDVALDCVGVANLLERMLSTQSTTAEYFHAMSKLSTIGPEIANLYVGFKGIGTRDECVCLATQLVNVLLYYRPRVHQMMVTTQTARLIRALQQQKIPEYWIGEMELFVWILFIVAMIPHDFEGKEWAMDLLCQSLCSKFGAETWPDSWQDTLSRVLLNFVWCDARLAPGFATICSSVAARVFGTVEDA